MKKVSLFLLAGFTTLMFSCKKDADSKDSTVTYQFATTNASTVSGTGRIAGSFLEWTGGTASVSEIKFEAKGENKVEYKSSVPKTVDLKAALSTLGDITVPHGSYEKIEFKIGFVPANGSSLELTGTYTPTAGSAAVPVVIRFHEPFEMKYEKKTPTTIDAGTDYTALSTLALGLLTQGVNESWLSGAEQTNGTIVISSTSNTSLYTPLWSAFQGLLKVEIKKK
ncbi:MAG TPA: hypothetical protein VGN63_04315 [Flavisolibacter sp.]|jgi:hypothetical protein|nr:hypothetical protein [Flavisolibacter sp.]